MEETTTETTEAPAEGSEEAPAEESPDFAAKLAAAESTNAGLRAMLAHIAPDLDVEKELDNIAFKRDGSPVYIGSDEPDAKAETKAKPTARTRPAQTRGAVGKASVKGMDDKGLAATVAKNGMRQFKE